MSKVFAGIRHPVLAAAVLAVSTGLVAERAAAQTEPVTYTAQYSASYKGRDVGTSVFSVRRDDAAGVYVYESTTNVKGLLRLASPNPVIDRSHFELTDGMIRPLRFWHEDGSRKGEDNHQIVFDWPAAEASISGDFGTVSVPLEPGALDRGSLQVALTLDLIKGGRPSRYVVADEDSLKVYEYGAAGEKRVATGIGEVSVVSYVQRREGSSRQTIIDFAPDLDYVPVRIEQIRDGETQSEFLLQSIQRP